MSDHYTDLERRAVWFALGVATVAGVVAVVLSNVHGYGQRSLSNPSVIVYDAAMCMAFLACGSVLGITLLAWIRGEEQ